MDEGSPRRILTRRAFVRGGARAVGLAVAACAGLAGGTSATAPGALHAHPPVAGLLPPPLLVFAGASIVAGLGVSRALAFPEKTVALLSPRRYDVANVAVSGRTVLAVDRAAPTEIDPRYAAGRANIVVLYAGFNDIVAGASAEETLARLAAFTAARRRVGFRVVLGTLLPSTVRLGSGRVYDEERQRVNASLRERAATYADALADLGADPTIGPAHAATDPAYYLPDGIHLTAAGHGIAAPLMKAAIARLNV